jgi:hypothetical protein
MCRSTFIFMCRSTLKGFRFGLRFVSGLHMGLGLGLHGLGICSS